MMKSNPAENGVEQPLPEIDISDRLLDAWAADIRSRLVRGWGMFCRDGMVVVISPNDRPLFWPDSDGRLSARLQNQ